MMGAARGILPDHTEATICTYTGKEFRPLAPVVEDIDIRDIAHALSQIVRYTGHVSDPWTVAAHSIEVSHRVERLVAPMGCAETARIMALVGLMHDASEAYLVDVPRPLKPHFQGYAAMEERLEKAIFERFRLPYPMGALVKEVDSDMLLDESANFFPPDSFIWRRYQIKSARNHPFLVPMYPKLTERKFLDRFHELGGVA